MNYNKPIQRLRNCAFSVLFAVFSTVKKGATWFLNCSPRYKHYGRNNNQYVLFFYSKEFKSSSFETYKTKKEINNVIKDLLNGNPLTLRHDYEPPGSKKTKIYPRRFYALKQISDNYGIIS